MGTRRWTAWALGVLVLPSLVVVIANSPAVAARCTVVGTPGNDALRGTAGADKICGFGGDDVLRGLGGNDVLLGGDGNDTIYPGRGRNVVRGNAGSDTLSYADLTSGTVLVDLPNGTATRAVTDTVTTIENVVGTAGNDRIIGTGASNRIVGRDGNDVLMGGLGDDEILGGNGDDTFYPGRGSNAVYGNAGVDTLRYDDLTSGTVLVDLPNGTVTQAVTDTLATIEDVFGTAGNDRLIGNTPSNRLVGQGGNDVLMGGPGDDEILGGDGDDRFYPGPGSNTVHGNAGVDTVRYDDLTTGTVRVDIPNRTVTRAVNDRLTTTENAYGTPRNDFIVGGDLPNQLVGQGGDDVILGGSGDDTLLGAAGNDRIFPASGSDIADGQEGTDQVNYSDLDCACSLSIDIAAGLAIETHNGDGSGGNIFVTDTVVGFEDLVGSDGWDTLKGTDGPNYINGGSGRDMIYPRLGRDVINGGGWYTHPDDSPAGGDSVNYSDRTSTGVNVDLIGGTGPEGSTITGIADVVGTNQDDSLVGSNQYASILDGRGGNDTISGRMRCGHLYGGEGDDVLRPYVGPASCLDWEWGGKFDYPAPQAVWGGAGQDRVYLDHATSAVTLIPPEDYSGLDWDGWSWMVGDIYNTVITAEIVFATPWADVIQGGGGGTQVSLYGRGGADEMDTVDGFGGDLMIQDGSGAGTICVGDATDTADC